MVRGSDKGDVYIHIGPFQLNIRMFIFYDAHLKDNRGAQTILPSHLYVVTAKCSGYFYKVNSRTDYAGA